MQIFYKYYLFLLLLEFKNTNENKLYSELEHEESQENNNCQDLKLDFNFTNEYIKEENQGIFRHDIEICNEIEQDNDLVCCNNLFNDIFSEDNMSILNEAIYFAHGDEKQKLKIIKDEIFTIYNKYNEFKIKLESINQDETFKNTINEFIKSFQSIKKMLDENCKNYQNKKKEQQTNDKELKQDDEINIIFSDIKKEMNELGILIFQNSQNINLFNSDIEIDYQLLLNNYNECVFCFENTTDDYIDYDELDSVIWCLRENISRMTKEIKEILARTNLYDRNSKKNKKNIRKKPFILKVQDISEKNAQKKNLKEFLLKKYALRNCLNFKKNFNEYKNDLENGNLCIIKEEEESLHEIENTADQFIQFDGNISTNGGLSDIDFKNKLHLSECKNDLENRNLCTINEEEEPSGSQNIESNSYSITLNYIEVTGSTDFGNISENSTFFSEKNEAFSFDQKNNEHQVENMMENSERNNTVSCKSEQQLNIGESMIQEDVISTDNNKVKKVNIINIKLEPNISSGKQEILDKQFKYTQNKILINEENEIQLQSDHIENDFDKNNFMLVDNSNMNYIHKKIKTLNKDSKKKIFEKEKISWWSKMKNTTIYRKMIEFIRKVKNFFRIKS